MTNDENEKLISEVDRILWEDWDPIGVNEISEARDEYSSYVFIVVRLLREGADAEQIAHHLKIIEEDTIGMTVYDDHRKRVACNLVAARASMNRELSN